MHELLQKAISSDIIVVVEGKKDRAALERLGLTNIKELSKKPLFQIAEEISDSSQECIILTDLDKKGKELYGKLSSDLQKMGVHIDNRLRKFLFKNTKLRQIEGMANLEILKPSDSVIYQGMG